MMSLVYSICCDLSNDWLILTSRWVSQRDSFLTHRTHTLYMINKYSDIIKRDYSVTVYGLRY